jgi:hypothetical protein
MIVDGAGSELERVDLRDAELDGLDMHAGPPPCRENGV